MSAYLDVENRTSREVIPGVHLQTFWRAQQMVSVVRLDADVVVPAHSHTAEQCGVVLAGSVTFTIDGETRVLQAGDGYMVAGDVLHTAVAGPDGARLFEVFSPVREEYKFSDA